MQNSSSKTEDSNCCIAQRDNWDNCMEATRVMSDSVKSLKTPFSCSVQLTFCQDEDKARCCRKVEILRPEDGRTPEALGLSHRSILPTFIIAASFCTVLSEFLLRSARRRSVIVTDCGFVILFCTPFGLIGCQHNRAASQESNVSLTWGFNSTPRPDV